MSIGFQILIIKSERHDSLSKIISIHIFGDVAMAVAEEGSEFITLISFNLEHISFWCSAKPTVLWVPHVFTIKGYNVLRAIYIHLCDYFVSILCTTSLKLSPRHHDNPSLNLSKTALLRKNSGENWEARSVVQRLNSKRMLIFLFTLGWQQEVIISKNQECPVKVYLTFFFPDVL